MRFIDRFSEFTFGLPAKVLLSIQLARTQILKGFRIYSGAMYVRALWWESVAALNHLCVHLH